MTDRKRCCLRKKWLTTSVSKFNEAFIKPLFCWCRHEQINEILSPNLYYCSTVENIGSFVGSGPEWKWWIVYHSTLVLWLQAWDRDKQIFEGSQTRLCQLEWGGIRDKKNCHDFGIRHQNFRYKNGIRDEKVYLVTTMLMTSLTVFMKHSYRQSYLHVALIERKRSIGKSRRGRNYHVSRVWRDFPRDNN